MKSWVGGGVGVSFPRHPTLFCAMISFTVHFVLIQLLIHHLFYPINSQQDDNFIVSGYLPEYRSYINVNASSMYLTDILLFSLSPEAVSKSDGCCLSKEHYDLIRQSRLYKQERQNKKLRLFLTVGGAGRSDGFAQVIGGDPNSQATFVNKLIQLW